MHSSSGTRKTNKEQCILSSALSLFSRWGIKKVSIEEICRESGTSKGTFYKYFVNKIALVLEIIANINKKYNDRFAVLLDQECGFETLAESIFNLKLEFVQQYSEQFLKDLYEGGIPEIEELLGKMQADARENSVKLYQVGISRGAIHKDISEEYFLYLLNQVMVMYSDPQLMAIYPLSARRTGMLFSQFFYGLKGKPEKESHSSPDS